MLLTMAPASKLGRGKPLKSQTKEVLQKIYRYFETEISRDPRSTVSPAQLVAHATGVSVNALRRLLSEHAQTSRNTTGDACGAAERRRRTRARRTSPAADDDAQDIRRTIHNFYTKDDEFPAMKDLFLILKAEIDYQGSLCTLRRRVAKLGFRWTNAEDSGSILIEKQDVRYDRIQYLTQIEAYRSQGRHIVYAAEARIEYDRTSTKPRADGSSAPLKHPARTRLTALLAGDERGLLPDTLHVHDDDARRHDEHEAWLQRLLPRLPPHSVLVLEAGGGRAGDPAPGPRATRRELVDWLTARGVPHLPEMFRPQLRRLVALQRARGGERRAEALLRAAGHTPLRAPARHPALNPARALLLELVAEAARLPPGSLMKVAQERVGSVDAAAWAARRRAVQAEEHALLATERVVDELCERAAVAAEAGGAAPRERDTNFEDDDDDDDSQESVEESD